ncbi:hypothetical protein C8Q75DRAFT_807129 [Abortiporus biennis]|nr:hypothetical protein C8Q75DRAFT_807129 [Abortiporus biennis]
MKRKENEHRDVSNPPDSASASGEHDDEVGPQTKRKKIGDREKLPQPKRTKRKGSLKDMSNMSLDILFEIFSQMHPQDLLNLSRATKAFRQLLTQVVDSLLESILRERGRSPSLPHCHNCLKANVKAVIWEIRARYCNSCKKTMLIRGNDRTTLSSLGIASSIRDASKLLTMVEFEAGSWEAPRYPTYFDIAIECKFWYKRKKASRSDELAQLRADRLTAMIAKVRELGYNTEVDRCLNVIHSRFDEEKFTRESKPLTDRAWDMLEPRIIDIMEEIRQNRHEDEYRTALENRMKPLQDMLLTLRRKYGDTNFLSIADFMNLPRIRNVADVFGENSLTAQDFLDRIEPDLPEILTDWKASITARLVQTIEEKIGVNGNVDPLTLAVGQFFRCKNCPSSVNPLRTYPDIYAHACYRRKIRDIYEVILQKSFIFRSSMRVDHIESMADIVQKIVLLAGLDSNTATAADMDNSGVQFVCDSCESPGTRAVMDWRAMVNHVGLHRAATPSIRAAEQDEINLVATLKETYIHREVQTYLCRQCTDQIYHIPHTSIRRHLRKKHGIDTTVPIDQHIIRDSDALPVLKGPRYLLSPESCKYRHQRGWELRARGEGTECDLEKLSKKGSNRLLIITGEYIQITLG